MAKCIWSQYGLEEERDCDHGFQCDRCPVYQRLLKWHPGTTTAPVARVSEQEVSILPAQLREMPPLPEDRAYCSSYLWVKEEGERRVQVGISGLLLKLLPRDLSLMLPRVGEHCRRDHCFCWIRGNRNTVFLPSPVEGMVRWVNNRLLEHPELLHHRPWEALLSLERETAEPLAECTLSVADIRRRFSRDVDSLVRDLREFVLQRQGIAAAGGELKESQPVIINTRNWFRLVQPLLLRNRRHPLPS